FLRQALPRDPWRIQGIEMEAWELAVRVRCPPLSTPEHPRLRALGDEGAALLAFVRRRRGMMNRVASTDVTVVVRQIVPVLALLPLEPAGFARSTPSKMLHVAALRARNEEAPLV